MARSLARNTSLFATSLDDTLTGATSLNTFELKVLDGYSFSQDVTTQEVGVNEAGTSPVRGTLGFNTALNPVDVSFSTYVRSYSNTEDTNGDTRSAADCVERILWASAMGDPTSWAYVIGTDVGTGHVITAQTDSALTFGLGASNVNELLSLTLYFVLEQTTYKITDFNVSTAEVDFSIDGIATINWTGQGSRVLEAPAEHTAIAAWDAGTEYLGVPATTTSTFLRNKLSTMDLKDNDLATTPAIDGIQHSVQTYTLGTGTVLEFGAQTLTAAMVGGRIRNNTVIAGDADDIRGWATIIAIDDGNDEITVSENVDADTITGSTKWTVSNDDLDIFTAVQSAGVVYNIPITGATLTLENNFTYLTPEELAIVNLPLAGFAGNRVTSGSLTAYLNTGATGSGGLLSDMLAKIEGSVSNNFEIIFHMGGAAADTPRVDFTIAHAQISVPTTNVEDIIATEIQFSGKPWSDSLEAGSFEDTNELVITYVPPA